MGPWVNISESWYKPYIILLLAVRERERKPIVLRTPLPCIKISGIHAPDAPVSFQWYDNICNEGRLNVLI